MKTTLISQNASPGLVIFRKELIQTLASQGHKVYCFAIDFTDATRAQVKSLGGIPVDYSLNRTGLNPLQDIRDTWALSRKLKDIQPDLMFSFFAKPVIYGSVAAKLAGIPQRIGMLEGLINKLARHASLEQLRWDGSVLSIVFFKKINMTDKLRAILYSNSFFYSFYRLFYRWIIR